MMTIAINHHEMMTAIRDKVTLTTVWARHGEDLPDGLLTGENWRSRHEEPRKHALK